MNQETKKLAIIIVTYNSVKHIPTCLESIRHQSLKGTAQIIVIDNNSSDGTQEFLTEQKDVLLVQNLDNEGYARAMNTGIKIAISQGYDYFLLLNPDIVLGSSFLKEIWPEQAGIEEWGACQGLLLLSRHNDLINSAGNNINFLGFGYVGDYMLALSQVKKSWDSVFTKIAYASGACVLIRREAIEAAGFFDEDLFAYHEDLDLGWRMWLQDFPSYLATKAIAYHDYEEGRHKDKFYYMERNRFLVIFKNYKASTLLVLMPILFATEMFILISSVINGWGLKKLRSYRHLLAYGYRVFSKRAQVSAKRKVRDRRMLELFTFKMNVSLPSAIRVALKVYYDFLRNIVSW